MGRVPLSQWADALNHNMTYYTISLHVSDSHGCGVVFHSSFLHIAHQCPLEAPYVYMLHRNVRGAKDVPAQVHPFAPVRTPFLLYGHI